MLQLRTLSLTLSLLVVCLIVSRTPASADSSVSGDEHDLEPRRQPIPPERQRRR